MRIPGEITYLLQKSLQSFPAELVRACTSKCLLLPMAATIQASQGYVGFSEIV